jgi:uncharacterized protein YqgV (UPF0045/DUF77 family)
MDFDRILADVPDYQVFKTVDELRESSEELVERFPQLVQRRVIGHAQNGEEIEALVIGRGSKSVLLFGCPHPNEPIGSMTLDYLSEKLAQNPGLLEELDLTWYIIKCVDPVGTRLNEGWFKGPFTPENYCKHFFRPASYQQVEWTFPVRYKTLHFDRPLPETQALMRMIEEAKPDFMYSLHNAGFGGAFYYVSHDLPQVYQGLRDHAAKRGLPLHRGEPEMPFVKIFSDAVYELPRIAEMYDFFAANSKADPAAIIRSGTCSVDYLERFNPSAFTLVCELPYFYDRQIEDTSKLESPLRDSLLQGMEFEQELVETLRTNFQPHLELLEASPFVDAVQEYLGMAPANLEARRMFISSNKSFDQSATVAQHFDSVINARFHRMLILGMALRAMEKTLPASTAEDAARVKEAKDAIQVYLDSIQTQLEGELNYTVIPIRTLIQVQLGAAFEVLKEGRTPQKRSKYVEHH